MSKITQSASGGECQIRMPGICNRDAATTVWCHLNGGGTGTTVPDIHGSYGCSSCHDEVDRRTRKTDLDYAKLCHHEGMVRSQLMLIEKGLM